MHVTLLQRFSDCYIKACCRKASKQADYTHLRNNYVSHHCSFTHNYYVFQCQLHKHLYFKWATLHRACQGAVLFHSARCYPFLHKRILLWIEKAAVPAATQLIEQTARIGTCYLIYAILSDGGSCFKPVYSIYGIVAGEASATVFSVITIKKISHTLKYPSKAWKQQPMAWLRFSSLYH